MVAFLVPQRLKSTIFFIPQNSDQIQIHSTKIGISGKKPGEFMEKTVILGKLNIFFSARFFTIFAMIFQVLPCLWFSTFYFENNH